MLVLPLPSSLSILRQLRTCGLLRQHRNLVKQLNMEFLIEVLSLGGFGGRGFLIILQHEDSTALVLGVPHLRSFVLTLSMQGALHWGSRS